MNEHSGNQDDSEDENLFGIKKTTYWEIYGVKRFPYSGKRKFTPLLYPSFHGGMVISNDVFGLTISQFERIYKACLERRKTKEQWILNLRYPDKSSNDYLEYLQNCTDCNIGQLLCYENFLLFDSLQNMLLILLFSKSLSKQTVSRKTKEQWLLNLRYPDKSSNEYLEYLQDCTDCNMENSITEKMKLQIGGSMTKIETISDEHKYKQRNIIGQNDIKEINDIYTK
ncbi:unnamed protein product [Mytilus edulis]|uniref:Uncharacterized protein n=1 Tax=Mytilus edulis TaxID=6550 RepID=A0A8S3RHG7_MYTED|nr:unnamed protein product [Mytilus edulis]